MDNDYTELEILARETPVSSDLKVSVVIPTFNRAEKLRRLLATLKHQTFPLERVEVIVADDGSSDGTCDVIVEVADQLDIRHVWQPNRGHRLAQVCNLGLRTARHDRIIMLQSDMLPGPALIQSYMRWLQLDYPLLLIGGRVFVTTDDFAAAALRADSGFEKRLPRIRTNNKMWTAYPACQVEDWREALYRQNDGLKKERWPFRAVVGSNLAFHRRLLDNIGGFDEEFQSWGGEDGEFGYRAFNAGYFFVPVREAIAYHQEPPHGENETDRLTGFQQSKLLRSKKCALPPFRTKNADGKDAGWTSAVATAQFDEVGLPSSSAVEINDFATRQMAPYILLSSRSVDAQLVDAIREEFFVLGTSIVIRSAATDDSAPQYIAFSRRTWARIGGFKTEPCSLQTLSSELEHVCHVRELHTDRS